MPKEHHYYVYILSSRSRTLYIGVTNSLVGRLLEHREGKDGSFTKRYAIHRLVYFERFKYINNAIAREKFLKHFTRAEKLALITESNPTWEDLGIELLAPLPRVVWVDDKTADPPLREG
jgi:putative endonuclease